MMVKTLAMMVVVLIKRLHHQTMLDGDDGDDEGACRKLCEHVVRSRV